MEESGPRKVTVTHALLILTQRGLLRRPLTLPHPYFILLFPRNKPAARSV